MNAEHIRIDHPTLCIFKYPQTIRIDGSLRTDVHDVQYELAAKSQHAAPGTVSTKVPKAHKSALNDTNNSPEFKI